MTSRAVSEWAKQLTTCYSTLTWIIDKHWQSPEADKEGKSLLKWSKSMQTLLNHVHGGYPSLGSVEEGDDPENMWSLLMDAVPETIDKLENFLSTDSSHYNPRNIEFLFERVQFHTASADLVSRYFERYSSSTTSSKIPD